MNSATAPREDSALPAELAEPATLRPLTPAAIKIAEQASDYFKALADSTRLAILYIIYANPGQKISQHSLSAALKVSAPTITHHMKKLLAAHLVERTPSGKWVHYTIHKDNAATIANIFDKA